MQRLKSQLSDEMRQKIIDKYSSRRNCKMISDDLNIKYQTVMSIIKLFMKTGRICALKTRSPKIKKLNAESTSFIMEKINEDVSITIKSLKTKLSVDKNVTVSASTIEREIKNFHYSFKRVQLVPARRNTENNIKERFIYANNYLLLMKTE